MEQRRQLEASLRASETRLRNILNHAPQGIVFSNAAGVITGWNRHAEVIFGWLEHEALGTPLAELLIPADRAAHHRGMRRFLESGETSFMGRRVEVGGLRKTGERFAMELALSVVEGPGGFEFTALVYDISDRRTQTELFETSFHHAAVGMAVVDLSGTFLKVNHAFCAMVGYGEMEMLNQDFQSLTHPDDLQADLSDLQRLLAGEVQSYQMEKRYIRKDGAPVWGHLSVSLVRDQDGAPKHFVAQVQDLTARREAEDKYRLLAENATDVISHSAMTGELLYLSPAVKAFTGYGAEELVGRKIQDLIHPDDLVGFAAIYERIVANDGNEKVTIEYRIRHKDGRWIWVEGNPTLLQSPDGKPVTVVDVSRDITDRKALEDQLRTARAEAEAAAAVKSEFLANMSHELRTPLTAIVGFTSLMSQHDGLEDILRGYVHRVDGASLALLALVNDLLDFSRLEAGQIEIRKSPSSAADLAQETLELFGAMASAKLVTLTAMDLASLPPRLLFDADRVRQVLINLIGNAVKFTDAGSVELAATHRSDRLRFEVTDTGPGLDVDQQKKLFARFSQVDGTSTRRHGGAGLGLAICRGLVEAMGGEVGVRSAPGEGSTFWFSLPAAPCEDVAFGETAEDLVAPLPGTRVLIVDDNPANRNLARVVLEQFQAEITEAEDGQGALELAARSPFDVILMDLRMPGMSGREAVQLLRSTLGPNQDAPILAFSAEAQMDQLERLRAEGFDGAICKPLTAHQLADAVGRATSSPDLSQQAQAAYAR